jgi:hypothetical protein
MYAYEIENWLNTKIRRTSWAHHDAYWYRAACGCWRNQRDIPIDRCLGELFSCDDWEPADVVEVFDWVLVGIDMEQGKRTAVIHQGFIEADAIESAYKIANSGRTVTKISYAKMVQKRNGESIQP